MFWFKSWYSRRWRTLSILSACGGWSQKWIAFLLAWRLSHRLVFGGCAFRCLIRLEYDRFGKKAKEKQSISRVLCRFVFHGGLYSLGNVFSIDPKSVMKDYQRNRELLAHIDTRASIHCHREAISPLWLLTMWRGAWEEEEEGQHDAIVESRAWVERRRRCRRVGVVPVSGVGITHNLPPREVYGSAFGGNPAWLDGVWL